MSNYKLGIMKKKTVEMEVQDTECPENSKCSSSGVQNDDGQKEDEKNDWQERKAGLQKESHPNIALMYIAHEVICIAVPTRSSSQI